MISNHHYSFHPIVHLYHLATSIHESIVNTYANATTFQDANSFVRGFGDNIVLLLCEYSSSCYGVTYSVAKEIDLPV